METKETKETRKAITIRVDPAFHKEIKMLLVNLGMTAQEYIENLIKKDIEIRKKGGET